MKSVSEISDELRTALNRTNMRQADLREAAGVTRQILANVLDGKDDHRLSTLLSLVDKPGLEMMLPKEAARRLANIPETPSVDFLVDQARKLVDCSNPRLRN